MLSTKEGDQMRILLAVSERDLLLCLQKALEFDGHDVIPAFDGVQAAASLQNDLPDAAIIHEKLTRITADQITESLNINGVPSIMLNVSRINEETLCTENTASSYLAFPFSPDELKSKLKAVMQIKQYGSEYDIFNVKIDEKRFKIGETKLTAEEIAILAHLAQNKTIPNECPYIYIGALNKKLACEQCGVRIEYVKNLGYRQVNDDE